MRTALKLALSLLLVGLAAGASAQDYNVGFRPRAAGGGGGGASCSSPADFINGSPAAAHLYFFTDTSWTAGGVPDDEASGTDIALSGSTGLTEAGDLSSADLPAGTFGSGTAVDLDGTSEAAYTNAAPTGWAVSANNGDHTAVFWVKLGALSTTDDLFAYAHGASDDGWVATASDGHIQYATPDDSSHLDSGSGALTASAWRMVAVVTDNDGSANGSDSRTIYVDGEIVAGPTADIDNAAQTPSSGYLNGFKPAGVTYKVHQLALFHSALTQTQIREIGCCGMNGETNPTDREGIIGGSGGSTCSGF